MKRKSKATKCSMCNAKSQMRNGRRVAIGVVGLCDDCRIVKPTKRRLLSLDEILDGLAAGK